MSSEQKSYKDKMTYRRIGNSGLFVSTISLGTWVNFGIEVKGTEARDLIKAALDNGINFLDTAEVYQDGEAEVALGKVLKDLGVPRSSIVVATKIFWGGADRKNPSANDYGCSRKRIIEGLAASLKRLDLEYVDIVFCHRNDKHTPIEETVRAMDYVINKGQAFYWGTSEWTAEEIQIAKLTAQRLNLIEPIVEQCQYNLIQRKAFEVDYKRLFTEGGYGSTVWSPLGGGILTGKYSKSKEGSLPENSRLSIDRLKWLTDLFLSGAATNMKWEDLIDRVDKLGELAKELGCTLPQLALAWVLANNHVSTALIGARNPTQLLENLGALDVVPKVTKEVNEKIDKIMGTAPTHLPDHTRRSERGIPESRP